MDAVRRRALEVLDAADLSPDGDALNARGFVWDMLVRHEQQHNETMLQTLHPPSRASTRRVRGRCRLRRSRATGRTW